MHILNKTSVPGPFKRCLSFAVVLDSLILLLRAHKAIKMCARSIYDVYDYREVSSVSLFEKLDWLPIDLCIKYFEGIQVYLKGFIKLVDHGRNTLNSNNNIKSAKN